MQTIGLLGGMSWESSAVYYKLINEGVRSRLGGLHSARIVLWSVEFQDVADKQAAGDWRSLLQLMIDGAKALERAGADMLLICTNTMHKLADEVAATVSIPLVHIADITAAAIKLTPSRRPLLLATRFTMEEPFYRGRMLDRHGLDPLRPRPEDESAVHDIIYRELCRGVVEPASKGSTSRPSSRLRMLSETTPSSSRSDSSRFPEVPESLPGVLPAAHSPPR